MKSFVYKISILMLVLATILSSFASCGGEEDDSLPIPLSFKEMLGYDYLKSIDGKKVTISGYLATSSPVDGSFIFLMNLPYQSCPFCIPNTSTLSNTIEVYPKSKDSFSYTAQAVKVVGTLAVAEDVSKPFTDKYNYEFTSKIVDATYTVINPDDLSPDMALWQRVAESGLVNDISRMYNYLSFVCAWNTYFVGNSTDENGNPIPGYYLYPTDAQNLIKNDGAQYNYGYKDGYFDSILAKIESIDKDAFSDLEENVKAAKALAEEALAELDAGNYTSEYKYVEDFGSYDYVYTINKGEYLKEKMNALYKEFSAWLGSWEM